MAVHKYSSILWRCYLFRFSRRAYSTKITQHTSLIHTGTEPRSHQEPIPEKNRKAMNMPTFTEPARHAPEMRTRMEGMMIDIFRPKRSATTLIPMEPQNAPAWNNPFMVEINERASGLVSSSKYARKEGCAVQGQKPREEPEAC